MPSKIAAELSRQQRERLAAMTPAERVALVVRMSEEGLASFMTAQGVDRETARRRIEATRRAGRRPSAAADR